MAKMKLKTGDTVRVIVGKDKGKEGKIISVDRAKNRVLVEGVNMATKHAKPSAANGGQGGIIHQEAAIDASNVVYLHNGEPTKIGIERKTVEKNGETKSVAVRIAKKTGEEIQEKKFERR